MLESIVIRQQQIKASISGLNASNLITDKAALIASLDCDNADEIAAILAQIPDHNDHARKGLEISVQDMTLDMASAVTDDYFADTRVDSWCDNASLNVVGHARWRHTPAVDSSGMPVESTFDLDKYNAHEMRVQDNRRYWDIESVLFKSDKGYASGYGRKPRLTAGSLSVVRPSKAERIAAKLLALNSK